jgi:hypothetical protein
MGLVGGGHHFLDEGLEGRVLAALELVADDGHLGFPLVVVEDEVAHAVGLHADDHVEVLAAEGLVVVGAVEPGGGVVLGAGALEDAVDDLAVGLVVVLRALEHEVLEQVGGAGGAGDLVAGADAVGDHEGHDRGGAVRHEEDLEAVGVEAVFIDAAEGLDVGEARDAGRGGREGRGGQAEGEEHEGTFYHKHGG